MGHDVNVSMYKILACEGEGLCDRQPGHAALCQGSVCRAEALPGSP